MIVPAGGFCLLRVVSRGFVKGGGGGGGWFWMKLIAALNRNDPLHCIHSNSFSQKFKIDTQNVIIF